jgi:hypothetical protein
MSKRAAAGDRPCQDRGNLAGCRAPIDRAGPPTRLARAGGPIRSPVVGRANPVGEALLMRIRLFAAGIVALAALGQAGCAVTQLQTVTPNPLIVPSADFETVWNKTVAVVDDYFDIKSENRLARKIVTEPKLGATFLEPWYGDSVGFRERLESSLQTIHRFAIVTVNPAPGGGFAVKVEVYKELEDLAKPDRQTAGRATFSDNFPVNRTREIVGPVPLPVQWIPRGRDAKLERVILNRIRDALFL